jgi:hypothetical protein
MQWVWQCTNANNIDEGKYKIYGRRHRIHETSITYGTRFRFVLTYCMLDLRFSQHCCWRFKSSWGCVVRVIVVISKYLREILACWRSVTSKTTGILFLSHVTMIIVSFLGAHSKIVKRDLALSCLSVCVSTLEQLGSHWIVFHEILYLRKKKKNCQENSSLLKIWEE